MNGGLNDNRDIKLITVETSKIIPLSGMFKRKGLQA